MTERYDLVAIGGGTAGLVATLGVAGFGGRAALVEAERTGGDCLWTGCVPSKALLAAAGAAHLMRTADRFGLTPTAPTIELTRVLAAVSRAQAAIAPHDGPERLRAAGVDVITGRARFVAPGRIEVGDRTLQYRRALVATGSRPTLPPVDGLATVEPLTSDTIWALTEVPARLAVLGGGPVGCELGQAMARLGSTVTIIEAEPTLLPRDDAEIGRFLAQRLQAEGLTVRTGVAARAVTPAATGPGGRLHLDDGTTVAFDRILAATGRRPTTAGLGLDQVGVELGPSGHVVVDAGLRTTGAGIFAAGDVTGILPYTPVAAYQARVVVGNALFPAIRQANYDHIPRVTFTDPEVARVGLDAATARHRWGHRAVVQRFPYAQLDRAITQATPHGWAELIGDPRRRLVGATIVGQSAGESMAEVVAWLRTGRRIDELSTTVHAYPTFAEAASRAADDVLRARYFAPRVVRFTRPLLRALRRLDHPR